MSNKPKSTVLYTSPFSKAYWRDAAAELEQALAAERAEAEAWAAAHPSQPGSTDQPNR